MSKRNRFTRILLTALLGVLTLQVANTNASSVPQVAAVADAIERDYFDARRGREIASVLRSKAAEGAFDHVSDPRALAAALTQLLEPHDGHFRVLWSPPEPSAPAESRLEEAAEHELADQDDSGRRANYGVRRVEVLPGNVGYIELAHFTHFDFDHSDHPARRAVDAALSVLENTDAVIFDLRDNGGGSPAMVGYLVSAFTPKGADIYNTFHSREGTSSEAPGDWYANPRLEAPLFILTSGRTASAAESFAYTLKNAGRARTVGEVTAGGANPGGTVDVGNGFHVFISTGSPTSPITRTNWEGTGVTPDLPTTTAEALHVAHVQALQDVLASGRLSKGGRTEAQWTLETLQATHKPIRMPVKNYAGDYGPVRVSESAGSLTLQRGRRPSWSLVALRPDVFASIADPSRRVTFQRDASDTISGLTVELSDGEAMHFARGSAPQR